MTCLTVTPDSAAEAIETGAQLIVTHHPILFRAVKRLTTATPEGRMLLIADPSRGRRLQSAHGIRQYPRRHQRFAGQSAGSDRSRTPAPHAADLGNARWLSLCRTADLARVSDALFAAGAGHIGQYSQCSFRLAGTGTFFGSDATNPTVGQKGRREEVSEWRLEVVCPESVVDAVVAAMRKAHSYEEPAFDVYPLRPTALCPWRGAARPLAAADAAGRAWRRKSRMS